MQYKVFDLKHLAEYLSFNDAGGLKKAEIAQLIHDYYHPLVPKPTDETLNMSVRVKRIFESNKKE